MKKLLGIAVFLAVTSTPALAQAPMSVDWDWLEAHKCSPHSPEFRMANVPVEVVKFEVALLDHDATSFNHGGGEFGQVGGGEVVIPAGALKAYRGPCPPNYSSFGHDYQFTVKAKDAAGGVLAEARKTKTFSASAVKK